MKRASAAHSSPAKRAIIATSSSSSYGQMDYWEKRMRDDENITWYFDYDVLKPLLGTSFTTFMYIPHVD